MPFGVLSMDVFSEAELILKQWNDDDGGQKINNLFHLIPKKHMPVNKNASRMMVEELKRITETLHTGIKQGLDIGRENRENALDYFYNNYLDVELTSLPRGAA